MYCQDSNILKEHAIVELAGERIMLLAMARTYVNGRPVRQQVADERGVVKIGRTRSVTKRAAGSENTIAHIAGPRAAREGERKDCPGCGHAASGGLPSRKMAAAPFLECAENAPS